MSTEGQSVRDKRPQGHCNAWRQGHCRFGGNCKFKHELNEKGIIKHGRGITPHVNKNGSETASSLSTPGPSKWSAETGQTRDPIYTISNFPVNSVTCRDWKSGKCTRGDSCRFNHTDEAGDTPGQDQKNFERPDRKHAIEKEREDQEIGILVAEMRARAERQAKEEAEKDKTKHQVTGGAERLDGKAQPVEQNLPWRSRKIENQKVQDIARQREEENKRMEAERRMREEQEARAELWKRKAEEEKHRNAERLAKEEAAREASKKQQLELQARRVQEATVVEQYLVFDSSLVTCTAGLDISCVVTGFDLCTVTVQNLPRDAKPEEIKDIFIQQGLKRSDFFLSNTKINLNRLEATVLVNAEYGHLITMGLEGIPFRNESLSISLSDNANVNSMDLSTRNQPFLLVTWRAPSDTLIATYLTMEEAQSWARKLNATSWRGRQIKAVMNERPQGPAGHRFFNSSSIKIMNLPAYRYIDTDLYRLTGSMNLRLLKSPRFDLEESFKTVGTHLRGFRGVRMDTYETLALGDQENAEAKIKVLFENWDNAQEAHASIGSIRGGPNSPYFRSWVPPKPLRYTIRIPKQQYDAQRRQWDALPQKSPGSGAHVECKVGSRGDVVFIEVLGQDKEALGPLKVRVESMVSGEKLGPEYWHQSMASNSAKAFFNRIYDETKVYVRNDFKTRSLKAYGEPDKVHEARLMILAEIERLAQGETTRMLDRSSVRFFVREGMGKLAELLGEENVNLNLASRPCRITVKGGEEAVHHLQRLLEEARATVFHDSVLAEIAEKDTCPICMDEASHPETLVCGHTYCAGCIRHFLISAVDTKNFPLVCMGNEATCNTPIAIPFIRRFLPVSVFQVLVETVFVSYLEEHPQELRYCTTPDCKQIYCRNTKKAVLQCPSCFSNICPACGEEAHENMTCEERKIHRNPGLQEHLNEEFARASGYKKCPQCQVWIEKIEGCNHMSCKCGAHICWRCMATSDRNGAFDGYTIYEHMRIAHGNIYDNPAEINDQPVGNQAHYDYVLPAMGRVDAQRILFAQPMVPQPQVQVVQQQQADMLREAIMARNVRLAQEQRRREVERENERLAAMRVQAVQQQQAEFERIRMAQNARALQEQRRREIERENERMRAEEARRREDRGWCVIM